MEERKKCERKRKWNEKEIGEEFVAFSVLDQEPRTAT
jgi:hypothetical protein